MSNLMQFMNAPHRVVRAEQAPVKNQDEQAKKEARERLQAAQREIEAALKVLQPKPKFATLHDFAMSLDDELVELLNEAYEDPSIPSADLSESEHV